MQRERSIEGTGSSRRGLMLKRVDLIYWYITAMLLLMIVRYILEISVPSFVFLVVSMFPVLLGDENQQIAFITSCIPFSITFQYKYALLILCVVWIWKSKGQLPAGNTLILVLLMMVWEFLHIFYGYFSFMEYLRGFTELLTLGLVMTRKLRSLDVKLIIRVLAASVVAVDCIMLFMQLQQNGFDIVEVLSRSAASYRFGQENMTSGRFALNFNANNLGFINNLSLCGLLFFYTQNRLKWYDIILAVASGIFALMTLSRTAVICFILIVGMTFVEWRGTSAKRIRSTFIFILFAIGIVAGVIHYMPFVIENLLERFRRADVTGGRSSLFAKYMQHSISSVAYCFFGVGMQGISRKMADLHGWSVLVPHNGLQEVFVAWGIVGVILVCMMLWQLVKQSKEQKGERRTIRCFSPLILLLCYSMAGQFLTSGRILMALVFAYAVMKSKPDDIIGGGKT